MSKRKRGWNQSCKHYNRLKRISSLRQSLHFLRGKLHDLDIELVAIARYKDFPDILAKEREILVVQQAFAEIEKEVTDLVEEN